MQLELLFTDSVLEKCARRPRVLAVLKTNYMCLCVKDASSPTTHCLLRAADEICVSPWTVWTFRAYVPVVGIFVLVRLQLLQRCLSNQQPTALQVSAENAKQSMSDTTSLCSDCVHMQRPCLIITEANIQTWLTLHHTRTRTCAHKHGDTQII